MKISDLENAVDAINAPENLFEVIIYVSKDEALWLISEVQREQQNVVGDIISDLIAEARCRP